MAHLYEGRPFRPAALIAYTWYATGGAASVAFAMEPLNDKALGGDGPTSC